MTDYKTKFSGIHYWLRDGLAVMALSIKLLRYNDGSFLIRDSSCHLVRGSSLDVEGDGNRDDDASLDDDQDDGLAEPTVWFRSNRAA